ncbi:hypothetical protein ACLNGM_17115 [Aureimonas phyllosphaerae]|uniref:hypothetical protein n=1 Tax=Aureimonas phyllosphaerae TaxID=1166078 RepID=UPI003A5BE249
MTRTHTVAFSELTRVLPWSLRALGYPLGTADRGSHVIATAAALDPTTLDDVAQLGHRPAEGFRLTREAAGGLVIEADGVSLLEIGPVVMDHFAAYAEDAGTLHCRIVGADDIGLLPAILLIGADYGLGSLALVRKDGEMAWSGAEPEDGSVVLHGASGQGAPDRPRSQNPTIETWLRKANPAPGEILLLVTSGNLGLDRSGSIETVDARVVLQAHAKGIPVSANTLQAFYDLETRTWMPSSERSRGQAGFTVPKEQAK